jgi:tetratricopeptide (TPR) repeat protein
MLYSQDNIDSILRLYERLPDDSIKILGLYDLAFEYRLKNMTSAKKMALQCLQSAKKNKNKNLLAKAYNVSGVILYRSGNYIKSKQLLERSRILLKELGDARALANLNINLGNIEQTNGEFSVALHYFEESEKIFAAQSDNESLNSCLLNKGSVLYEMKKFHLAKDNLESSLDMAIRRNDKYLESASLNNLSVIWRELKNFELSLQTAQKAYIINDMIGNEIEKADNFLSIGETYAALGQGDSALLYWKRSQQISEAEKYTETEREASKLLSYALESAGQYKEALYYQRRVEALTEPKKEHANGGEDELFNTVEETHYDKQHKKVIILCSLLLLSILTFIYFYFIKKRKNE